jgi:hypothetical protein
MNSFVSSVALSVAVVMVGMEKSLTTVGAPSPSGKIKFLLKKLQRLTSSIERKKMLKLNKDRKLVKEYLRETFPEVEQGRR